MMNKSLVHFLVHANEFDVKGLIVSTGCWRKSQRDRQLLDKILNAYGKAYNNLKVHSKDFPSLNALKAVSGYGQKGYSMGDVGSGKDSFGSNLIIKAIDEKDKPLWIQCWGGRMGINKKSGLKGMKPVNSQGKYSDANHHPIAVLKRDASKKVLEISASADSSLKLSAAGSKDPDRNKLSYSWNYYKEPSSYNGSVSISGSKSSSASVSIPSDGRGKTIHIILTLSDNGSPSLVSYRRAVIKGQ